MDNAKIHHIPEVRELIEAAGMFYLYASYAYIDISPGVRLVFLPPYSPDFNPIEEAFAQVKALLRHHTIYFNSKKGAAKMYELSCAMTVVSGEDAVGYFMHAGYF
jgi:transposase